jgi:aryl-alcohol dehydrogenase-like predicted oxidoreductase
MSAVEARLQRLRTDWIDFDQVHTPDPNTAIDETPRALGRVLLEVAFAWLLANPVVSSVITGATKPEQVDRNVSAGAWELSPAERAEIGRLTGPGAPPA